MKAKSEVRTCFHCHGLIDLDEILPRPIFGWNPSKKSRSWFCSFECHWDNNRCEELDI